MSPVLFHTVLYASLILCALGLVWRFSAWLSVSIGPDAREFTPFQRTVAVFRDARSAPLGRGAIDFAVTFFLDVLLLRRLFATERLRWLGHLLVVVGFTLLLLMHALAALLSAKLFPGYQPTLNPYLFLRNLFGVMVLAGVALIFIGRWRRSSGFPSVRRPLGAAFVALLVIVLVSGFLLEAAKIASPRVFYRMADQYAGSTDPDQLRPLRAVWASEYGVVFSDLNQTVDPQLVAQGRDLHDNACASCHSKPVSAFVSYPVARVLAPVGGLPEAVPADVWLLYVHVFAGFIGLASLPFTRFFHAVANPISLLVNGTGPGRKFSPAGRAWRRALALDACVRCGICDARCAVAPLARYLGNPLLLPSHKLVATGTLANGRLLRRGREDEALRAADGAFLCTDCGRCTSRCPVGLDLDDLWQAGRGDLAAVGLPRPAQWAQARPAVDWADSLEQLPAQRFPSAADAAFAPLSSDRDSFSRCVQCQTCTNVCPVVAHSMASSHGVDLTPQKVMNLLRLGLCDLTLGSRMVWDCATCYQCQQICPEGIRVTDIMCELRALSVQRLGAVRERRETA